MLSFKKIIFIAIYNLCLLLFLIIGIQNSNNKNKVYFLKKETIEMPLSFILGISFISGSIFSNIFYLVKEDLKQDD